MIILRNILRRWQYAILPIALILLISACAPPPPTSPAPSSTPASSEGAARRMPTPISSAEEAVMVAKDYDPRFTHFGPLDPNVIGSSSWYTVEATDGGWLVTFVLGWGDCPAGCIDKHEWRIVVLDDGTVAGISETGPDVPNVIFNGE